MTCPECELNKQRAQLWRNEAYKHAGHQLDWEPELIFRQKPLTNEAITAMWRQPVLALAALEFARDIEREHGIED